MNIFITADLKSTDAVTFLSKTRCVKWCDVAPPESDFRPPAGFSAGVAVAAAAGVLRDVPGGVCKVCVFCHVWP